MVAFLLKIKADDLLKRLGLCHAIWGCFLPRRREVQRDDLGWGLHFGYYSNRADNPRASFEEFIIGA
jgi:hypothetical protein